MSVPFAKPGRPHGPSFFPNRIHPLPTVPASAGGATNVLFFQKKDTRQGWPLFHPCRQRPAHWNIPRAADILWLLPNPIYPSSQERCSRRMFCKCHRAHSITDARYCYDSFVVADCWYNTWSAIQIENPVTIPQGLLRSTRLLLFSVA